MKVVVIGLGSMGKRRIRLIRKYDQTIQLVGVDLSQDRRDTASFEYGIDTYANLEHCLNENKPGNAFICTSPLSHSGIITICLEHGINVFTELNLVSDSYENNINLAKEKNLTLFMSSTFLYRDEIKKIKSLVNEADCQLNYSYHIGQYLPDWHPWENYKDFFVGNKRSNGCREILAIELPWVTDVFGTIVKMDVVKNKISSLNLDYNDNYLMIAQHSSGNKGMLAVDIVSRKAVRNLEIFGEQLYLSWDGTPTGLNIYDFKEKKEVNIDLYQEVDHLDNYSSFVIENAYLNEIVSFFEAVNQDKNLIYSFEKDRDILSIIDRIED